jgi:hypothetical protein
LDHAQAVRSIVYGHTGPGLSTYLKDDLGSYTPAALQVRIRTGPRARWRPVP